MADPRPGTAYWGKPRKTLTATRSEGWVQRAPPRERVRKAPLRCRVCGQPDTQLCPLVPVDPGGTWVCQGDMRGAYDALLQGGAPQAP